MAIIVSNDGEIELLRKMIKDALADDEDYVLKLYQNDISPIASSQSSDFFEADFDGYSAKTLTRSGWSDPELSSGKAITTYSSQSWTCTGTFGNTIRGYYVLGSDSGKLLWAERRSSAAELTLNDTFSMTPVFTLQSEN